MKTKKPTYAEILRKSRNHSTRPNLMTNLESNTKPNIHEKLQSMNPKNKHQKPGTQTFSNTRNDNDDKQQQKDMNLKYKHRPDKKWAIHQTEFKKRKCRLCNEQRPARKHRLTQSNQLCGRNHGNFFRLRRTIEDTIGL